MSNYACKITVSINQGHTGRPVAPSNCYRLARADCLARSNGRVVWSNNCPNRVNTGGWRSGNICYVTYKCNGCNYLCQRGNGPVV